MEVLENRVQTCHTCDKTTGESIAEQITGEQIAGDVLPVVTAQDSAASSVGLEGLAPEREGRLPRSAAQVAATLIARQLDTPQHRPYKRKYVSTVSDASNSTLTASLDSVVARAETLDANASNLYSLSPANLNNDSQDKQLPLPGSD